MTMTDFITDGFCRIDEERRPVPKHPPAYLGPSEVVTVGVLHALKGVGNRAFSRWLIRDYHALFPRLPERTGLFRSLTTHRGWTVHFLAQPTLLGVIDRYGIELIHPVREGRRPRQIGRKGNSNPRWSVGYQLCLVINPWGGLGGWWRALAPVHDPLFHPLIAVFQDRRLSRADTSFHAHQGDPPKLKLCPRGTWNDRRRIETVFSMLTLISHTQKRMHRVIDSREARLAFPVAAFKRLVQGEGLNSEPDSFVPLSMAEFNG